MKKISKAQATAFIVLAVIIVAFAALIIYFNQNSYSSNLNRIFSRLEINAQADQVQSSILGCLESTAKDALLIIGIQGGYYNKPEKLHDLEWSFIPYYYYEGQFLMPSTEKIESELSDYVDENLDTCLKSIETNDFSMNFNSALTKTMINEKEVDFQTTLRINFEKESETAEYKLENSPIKIESALSDIIDVASYITETHKEDPENICISCVTDMALERNLYVEMIEFDDPSNILVVISENYTSSEPYVFEFLNKYP